MKPNKSGERKFSPILVRGNNNTNSDGGGGLQFSGNPILSFNIHLEPRYLVLGKWFRILQSLTNVSNVTFTG